LGTLNLGKVRITFGGEWDETKDYELLTIVNNSYGVKYISKQDVPAGKELSDKAYWEPISGDFVEQYQGAKDKDPTKRNDGTPLQKGDLYFNTEIGGLEIYDGTDWKLVSSTSSNAEAVIDDDVISTKRTWSSDKINSKFVELKSEAPALDMPKNANENTEVTITITNYKSDTDYHFSTNAGTIKYSGGNTATLTTKDVEEDTEATVSCYAIETGKLRSDTTTKNITILKVPITSDGTISNADFSKNADTSDGFKY